MSGRLTRAAYKELIEDDVAWLEKALAQRLNCLAGKHVVDVLRRSAVLEYDTEDRERAAYDRGVAAGRAEAVEEICALLSERQRAASDAGERARAAGRLHVADCRDSDEVTLRNAVNEIWRRSRAAGPSKQGGGTP